MAAVSTTWRSPPVFRKSPAAAASVFTRPQQLRDGVPIATATSLHGSVDVLVEGDPP
jgi:hypothetical protein